MGLARAHFPRVGFEWACCPRCGFSYPANLFSFDSKYGWQCPNPGCHDLRPDREDWLAARRFPLDEGVRRTKAPVCNSLTEGLDPGDSTDPDNPPQPDLTGYGTSDYGGGEYGGGD